MFLASRTWALTYLVPVLPCALRASGIASASARPRGLSLLLSTSWRRLRQAALLVRGPRFIGTACSAFSSRAMISESFQT